MKKIDILGIDKPCLDEILIVDRIPCLNESMPILDLSYQGGGKTATALAAASRLGARAAVICKLGKDKTSRFLIDDFQNHGLDVSGIITDEDASAGYSVILSGKDERRIIWQAGQMELDAEDIDEGLIASSSILHICRLGKGEQQALEFAKKNSVLVSLDGDFYSPELAALLADTDIFIGSEEFYQGMFSPSSAAYRENLASIQGPKIIIFTFGAKGGRALCGGDYFEWEAFTNNIQVKDTAGAGDVFHGAFLRAYSGGVSPREAVRYAAAASAIKCTRTGGRAGIPDHREVENYLKTGEFNSEPLEEREMYYRRAYRNY
jgi:sugar/nucleoside kinase (ribokinase family)